MNHSIEISREEIAQLTGLVMLEFGAHWCGHCQAAQAIISKALLIYPNVNHISIEDGKGKRLGRQFSIKLWPTLVFLKNGVEVNRLVRPLNAQHIIDILNELSL